MYLNSECTEPFVECLTWQNRAAARPPLYVPVILITNLLSVFSGIQMFSQKHNFWCWVKKKKKHYRKDWWPWAEGLFLSEGENSSDGLIVQTTERPSFIHHFHEEHPWVLPAPSSLYFLKQTDLGKVLPRQTRTIKAPEVVSPALTRLHRALCSEIMFLSPWHICLHLFQESSVSQWHSG